MNNLVKIIQGTSQLIILMAVLGMVIKVFFGKSLVGRFMLYFLREMFTGLKTTIRILKYISKHGYKGTKVAVKFVADHYKTFKSRETEQEQEIVNGESNSNVIDLNTFKQLRHKWDK